jgi:hypothetical protein
MPTLQLQGSVPCHALSSPPIPPPPHPLQSAPRLHITRCACTQLSIHGCCSGAQKLIYDAHSLGPGGRGAAVASSLIRPPTRPLIVARRRLHMLLARHPQPRWWRRRRRRPLPHRWRARPKRRLASSGAWWQCPSSLQPRGHGHGLWQHRPGWPRWPRWLGGPQWPWWNCCWLPAWPRPGLALRGLFRAWRWLGPAWWPAAAGWWSALRLRWWWW